MCGWRRASAKLQLTYRTNECRNKCLEWFVMKHYCGNNDWYRCILVSSEDVWKIQMPESYSQRLCIGLSIRILKNSSGNSIVQARWKKLPLYLYQTRFIFTYSMHSFDSLMLYFNPLLYFNLIKPVLLHILPCTAQIPWCFKPQENHVENSNNLASEVQPMI